MNKKLNVLLVDDSPNVINYLTETLQELGDILTVTSATNLPDAQAILRQEKTDVVILDIHTPDGNGIDFLKWAKYFYPWIRIIMFSNTADECHRAISKEYGADMFLDKSFEFDKIPLILSEMSKDKLHILNNIQRENILRHSKVYTSSSLSLSPGEGK